MTIYQNVLVFCMDIIIPEIEFPYMVAFKSFL